MTAPLPPVPPPPPFPATPPRRRGLVLTVGLLALALVASLGVNVAQFLGRPTDGQRSFATPEEAITFYVAAIGKGDVATAVSAYATTSMAKRYDLNESMIKHGSWVFNDYTPVVMDTDVGRAIWAEQFHQMARHLSLVRVATLTVDDPIVLERPVSDEPEVLKTLLHPERLNGSLKIKEIKLVEGYGKLQGKTLTDPPHNPEDAVDAYVLLTSDHGDYILSQALMKYDGRWQLATGRGHPISFGKDILGSTFVAAEPGAWEKLLHDLDASEAKYR
ncbi:hypothetical protein [Arachnia propionica]|uniref:Uncharacterized protein n=1 Tax=Arachnia propionica TaxID=1750 RepID=A0A3P1WQQ5_9ACTN|nr:hypothetical protein [Arachnia propionica]RRD48924.1 hypothetical protein EII35_10475 [Arachnia propionica]